MSLAPRGLPRHAHQPCIALRVVSHALAFGLGVRAGVSDECPDTPGGFAEVDVVALDEEEHHRADGENERREEAEKPGLRGGGLREPAVEPGRGDEMKRKKTATITDSMGSLFNTCS